MNLHPELTWLGQQLHAIGGLIAAVASNGSMPARQVLIYTFVIIALAYLIPKTVKKFGK